MPIHQGSFILIGRWKVGIGIGIGNVKYEM
jgi:hypothetical protein